MTDAAVVDGGPLVDPKASKREAAAAKKLTAAWKKQVKQLKAKDPDKKRDALRFCTQDARFFREQPEVLPVLLGLLARLKTPELVLDALTTLEALLAPQLDGDTEALQLQGEPGEEGVRPFCISKDDATANSTYVIERCVTDEFEYQGGQPFVALISAPTASNEIKIKAIQVFTTLLEVCIAQSASVGGSEASTTLSRFQSAGSPICALVVCLEADCAPLQFAALSCVKLLICSDPNHSLLDEFESNNGFTRVLQLGRHADRRFHDVLLVILDVFSEEAHTRALLCRHGSLDTLKDMLHECVQTVDTATTTIAAQGATACALSPQDVVILRAVIPRICKVFVRLAFGADTSGGNTILDASSAAADACFSVVDSVISLLRRDVGNASLGTSAAPPASAPVGSGNAAAQAAAAAAANAAAAAAFFPFEIDRMIVYLGCLGRMIERNPECKKRATSDRILQIAFECLKIPNESKLHQAADKMLHQCCVRSGSRTDIDELSGVSPDVDVDDRLFGISAPPGEAQGAEVEEEPLISAEAIATMLNNALSSSNHALVFRLVRWIALVVDPPANARMLGDHCVAVLLKVLSSSELHQTLMIGLVTKCIGVAVQASSSGLEACCSDGMDPTAKVIAFLESFGHPQAQIESDSASVSNIDVDVDSDDFKLEWIDEWKEETIFEPLPLTDTRHSIDPYLFGAQVLLSILKSFEQHSPEEWRTVNFGDLFSQRDAPSGTQSARTAPAIANTTGASKKRLDTPKAPIVGESIVSSVLSSARNLWKLIPVFAGINTSVCVALLEALSRLLMLSGGTKVLVELAAFDSGSVGSNKDEAGGEAIQEGNNVETATDAWPLDVDKCLKSSYSVVIEPVLIVLHSPATSFAEVEAAVQMLSLLTEVSRSDSLAGQAISDSDCFANVAVARGVLVVLLAYLDEVRIPQPPCSARERRNQLVATIELLVLRFVEWGVAKQAATTTEDAEETPSSAQTEMDLTAQQQPIDNQSSYAKTWAKQLLDRRFDAPRFDYISYPPLLLAAELDKTAIALALLKAGASGDISSECGTTPLMLALLNGDAELVAELIAGEASLDAMTCDGGDYAVWAFALVSSGGQAQNLISQTYCAAMTHTTEANAIPLLLALDNIRGEPVFFEDCLNHGFDVNVSNHEGDFLLHTILSKLLVRRTIRGLNLCYRFDSRLSDKATISKWVTLLIETHAADVNKANRLGQTPLHLALMYGHSEAVTILLSHCANPNVRDAHGYLPLHYASCGLCGEPDGSDGQAVELIEKLLEASTRFPIIDGKHVDDRKHKSGAEKRTLEIEDILARGLANIVEPLSIISKLAVADDILNVPSFVIGLMPWHMTCGGFLHFPDTFCLDDEMAQFFAENGCGRARILNHYIEKRCVDVGQTAHKGISGLHFAIKTADHGNNDELIELLLEQYEAGKSSKQLDINAVHELSTIDCLPMIPCGTEVIVGGCEPSGTRGYVSVRSMDGKYRVLLQSGQYTESLSRQQLQLGGDTGQSSSDTMGKYRLFIESCFSALHYALQTSDALSERLLRVPELSLEAPGSDIPFLALACAAHRSPAVVKHLISRTANVRVQLPLVTSPQDVFAAASCLSSASSIARQKHATALHYAVMYEDVDLTCELVSNPNVNVNVRRSGDGFTPLHLACGMGNLEVVRVLLAHGALIVETSSSCDNVSPLQLLVNNDTGDNDNFRALISEEWVDVSVLFGDLASSLGVDDSIGENQDVHNDADGSCGRSCFLLDVETQNLHLYERIQQLHDSARRASILGMIRKLESELAKSNGVLSLCFDLVRDSSGRTPKLETDQEITRRSKIKSTAPAGAVDVATLFESLPHPHPCYRRYQLCSEWSEVPRAVLNSSGAATRGPEYDG